MTAIHGLLSWAPLGLPAYVFLITVVVFFHELGHFAVARWCGVKVETFSIGFGPALVGWDDRKGTRWKISAIPLPAEVGLSAHYTVTVLRDAPKSGAARFVSFLLGPQGQAIMRQHGLDAIKPTVTGDAQALPSTVRSSLDAGK